MGIFDGFLGVPTWADALTAKEYSRFSELLSSALRARSLPTGLRHGSVSTIVDGDRSELHFKTLARKCKLASFDAWEALITEQLDFALCPTAALLARFEASFSLARKYLKVQLVPENYRRDDWTEGLNFQAFSTGVVAALVYDLPQSVITVPAKSVRAWAQSFESLFEVAAEQVRADPTLGLVEREQDSGCVINRLVGESFFVCSQALWLERFLEARADRGVMVSIPSRQCVQFSAIVDRSAITALQVLAVAGVTLYETMPGEISPALFWIRAGQVVPIPVSKSESGQVQVMPPSSFMAVLEGLGGDS